MARNVRSAAVAVEEEKIINNEMITPDNLSMKLLREIVKEAGLNVLRNNPLMVEMDYPVVIVHDPGAKNVIGFSTALKFKEGYTMHEYLKCANKINHMRIMKAVVLHEDNPHLLIGFDFLITGALTKKIIINTLSWFASIARHIYTDHKHIVG